MDKMHVGSGLSRKYSTKRLNLGTAPKNTSPTIALVPPQALQDTTTLDPSPAAVTASTHLTANMGSQPSPGTIQQLSPTSPAYSVAPSTVTPRHFPRSEPSTDSYLSGGTLTASTIGAPSVSDAASTAPSRRDRDRDRDRDKRGVGADGDVEIFKSFRVSIEDPCHKVLPVALKRYNINDDWRQYALYIVHGDQERCLGLEEKPLMLFKQLDREGRKPMFMLRKHASPAGEGWSGPGQGAGAEMRGLPGGVL
ncbi:RA-domain-containing protein [Myriangium duriaei CBS 260.36]|uniref:RA-domain-containing protein n=1 Tax=Myriangium duriaei CBS 260.36 TaxID=1168546 RepID=A0A9P4MRK1_9PEZI|nr:RA-domain-containing protein [Myriangium duriaei CBS 260.36]